jgi:hypothetical protein
MNFKGIGGGGGGPGGGGGGPTGCAGTTACGGGATIGGGAGGRFGWNRNGFLSASVGSGAGSFNASSRTSSDP